MKRGIQLLIMLGATFGAGFLIGKFGDRSFGAGDGNGLVTMLGLAGGALALLLVVWLLWRFLRGLRPLTHIPDLMDANPADVARRAGLPQPPIGQVLGLDNIDSREPVQAIDGALAQLEREAVPAAPVEEIRSALRRVENVMEAAAAVGSGDLPIVQRACAVRPMVIEAMGRHGLDQLSGAATPEIKVPAKVVALILDRMMESAGSQARVEIHEGGVRLHDLATQPQTFGWNLAKDLAARYKGALKLAGRSVEWNW